MYLLIPKYQVHISFNTLFTLLFIFWTLSNHDGLWIIKVSKVHSFCWMFLYQKSLNLHNRLCKEHAMTNVNSIKVNQCIYEHHICLSRTNPEILLTEMVFLLKIIIFMGSGLFLLFNLDNTNQIESCKKGNIKNWKYTHIYYKYRINFIKSQ